MNGYELQKNFFKVSENCEGKINLKHAGLYFYISHKANLLQWPDSFGLPTDLTMEVLSISTYRVYKKLLQELSEFGLIKIVSKSKNQHTATRISIPKIAESAENTVLENADALDNASDMLCTKNTKQSTKQRVGLGYHNKTIKTIKHTNNNIYTDAPVSKVVEPKHPLIEFAKEQAPRVMKMKKPLTAIQAESLLKNYELEELKDILLSMENYQPLLTKSLDANLTIQNWLKRNKKQIGKTNGQNRNNYQANRSYKTTGERISSMYEGV